MKASATSRLLSVASPYHQTAAAPRLPTIGPASAICASRQAFCGILLQQDGGAQERDEHRRADGQALALRLERVPRPRGRTTARRSRAANFQPQSSEYAPIETTIDSDVVTTLNLKIAKRMYLNFSRKAPTHDQRRSQLAQQAEPGLVADRPGLVRLVGLVRRRLACDLAHEAHRSFVTSVCQRRAETMRPGGVPVLQRAIPVTAYSGGWS